MKLEKRCLSVKHKPVTWIFAFILVITIAAAVPVNHETTSVSRIVADSPGQMRRQLFTSGFTLQDAELFTQRTFETRYDVNSIMTSQFQSMSSMPQFSGWRFADVEDQLSNGQNNYLVLNSRTSSTPYSTSQGTIDDINDWELTEKNLFVFDSKYAGLHMPARTSFTSKLSAKAPYIAPLSYPSAQFVKSLVCNLGKHPRLGEAFRQARNNYYINTNLRSEFLGLTLLSYALYGSPRTNVLIPTWNTQARQRLCGEYDNTYGTQAADILEIQQHQLVKQVTANMGEPTTAAYDEFTIIETPNTQSKFAEDELITPFKTEITKFPLNTLITNVTFIGFEDPVELTVDDTPMWNGDSMQEKTCYTETDSPTAEFSYAVSEEELVVVAHINPVEVISCSQGRFKIYKTARYQIEYTPNSPILIEEVIHPATMTPNQTTNIQVEIENIQSEPVTGILALVGEEGVISTVEVTSTQTSYYLELIAPEEGLHNYRIEFVQENESKTFSEFEINVAVLEAQLIIPEIVGQSATVTLEITNMLSETINATINDILTHDEQTITSNDQEMQLPPGTTTINLEYDNLEKEAISYDLLVNIAYLETNKLLWGTIITNHAPTILQGNVVLKEGDTVQITPEVTDLDEDDVSMTIDSPLPLDGSYTLAYEDSGVYIISIEASDGIITIEKTISLTVENVNRPPTLTVPETITVSEGQEASIGASASDPDNQNSVNNDDNALTITYSAPFDSNGKYTPSYDASGEFTTLVSVSDGEFTDTKIVTVTVLNVNRPPHLNDLTDITINEGETVYAQVGRDPDNENIDPSDDNNITHRYFNVPLDHEGKWKTNHENSGNYTVGVEVSDGTLGVRKNVRLTILNVNRPPVISAPEVIYANGSADLSVYISDPDNMNSVTNDDNVLTINYGGSPFDANGVWSPTIPDSTAYTTITVSDGEFTVSKYVAVHVAQVNVPPAQTPPAPQTLPSESTQPTETITPVTTTPPVETIPPAPAPQPTTEPEGTAEPNPETTPTEETTTEENITASPAPVVVIVPPATDSTSTAPAVQPAPAPALTETPAVPAPALTETQPTQQTATQNTAAAQIDELSIQVKVGSKKVEDGDSVKVKPDKELKIEIDIKNNAAEEKEIEIEASIDDLDQDEEDSVTLDPNEQEEFKYTFDIPRLTEDDEYDLDIFVRDSKQTREWNILLKIDKPSHEVNIKQFSITPEIVQCEQTSAELQLKLENTGKNDEEGTILFESATLDILETMPFDLAEGESKLYKKTISALKTGTHDIKAKADYGKTEEQTKTLTVQPCIAEEATVTHAEPETPRVGISSGQQMAKTVTNADTMPAKDIASIAFVILSGLFAVTLIIFAMRFRN